MKTKSAYHACQGSATFWTSGQHLVLTRFQHATTIPVDQKRKVFARNSSLFSTQKMAKTKKKDLHQEFKHFSTQKLAKTTRKIFSIFLVHICHWKQKQNCGPNDNKRSQAG